MGRRRIRNRRHVGLCRLCERKVYNFDKCDETSARDLWHTIDKLLEIKITPDDRCSTLVCRVCCNYLVQFDLLKKRAHKTQKGIDEFLKVAEQLAHSANQSIDQKPIKVEEQTHDIFSDDTVYNDEAHQRRKSSRVSRPCSRASRQPSDASETSSASSCEFTETARKRMQQRRRKRNMKRILYVTDSEDEESEESGHRPVMKRCSVRLVKLKLPKNATIGTTFAMKRKRDNNESVIEENPAKRSLSSASASKKLDDVSINPEATAQQDSVPKVPPKIYEVPDTTLPSTSRLTPSPLPTQAPVSRSIRVVLNPGSNKRLSIATHEEYPVTPIKYEPLTVELVNSDSDFLKSWCSQMLGMAKLTSASPETVEEPATVDQTIVNPTPTTTPKNIAPSPLNMDATTKTIDAIVPTSEANASIAVPTPEDSEPFDPNESLLVINVEKTRMEQEKLLKENKIVRNRHIKFTAPRNKTPTIEVLAKTTVESSSKAKPPEIRKYRVIKVIPVNTNNKSDIQNVLSDEQPTNAASSVIETDQPGLDDVTKQEIPEQKTIVNQIQLTPSNSVSMTHLSNTDSSPSMVVAQPKSAGNMPPPAVRPKPTPMVITAPITLTKPVISQLKSAGIRVRRDSINQAPVELPEPTAMVTAAPASSNPAVSQVVTAAIRGRRNSIVVYKPNQGPATNQAPVVRPEPTVERPEATPMAVPAAQLAPSNQAVSQVRAAGIRGRRDSMAVHNQNQPHVVRQDPTVERPEPMVVPAAQLDPGNPTVSQVRAAGIRGRRDSMAVHNQNQPNVVRQDPTVERPEPMVVPAAQLDSGNPTVSQVRAAGIRGRRDSMAVHNQNQPHVVRQDSTVERPEPMVVPAAQLDSGNPTVSQVRAAGIRGRRDSMAVHNQNQPHVVRQDPTVERPEPMVVPAAQLDPGNPTVSQVRAAGIRGRRDSMVVHSQNQAPVARADITVERPEPTAVVTAAQLAPSVPAVSQVRTAVIRGRRNSIAVQQPKQGSSTNYQAPVARTDPTPTQNIPNVDKLRAVAVPMPRAVGAVMAVGSFKILSPNEVNSRAMGSSVEPKTDSQNNTLPNPTHPCQSRNPLHTTGPPRVITVQMKPSILSNPIQMPHRNTSHTTVQSRTPTATAVTASNQNALLRTPTRTYPGPTPNRVPPQYAGRQYTGRQNMAHPQHMAPPPVPNKPPQQTAPAFIHIHTNSQTHTPQTVQIPRHTVGHMTQNTQNGQPAHTKTLTRKPTQTHTPNIQLHSPMATTSNLSTTHNRLHSPMATNSNQSTQIVQAPSNVTTTVTKPSNPSNTVPNVSSQTGNGTANGTSSASDDEKKKTHMRIRVRQSKTGSTLSIILQDGERDLNYDNLQGPDIEKMRYNLNQAKIINPLLMAFARTKPDDEALAILTRLLEPVWLNKLKQAIANH